MRARFESGESKRCFEDRRDFHKNHGISQRLRSAESARGRVKPSAGFVYTDSRGIMKEEMTREKKASPVKTIGGRKVKRNIMAKQMPKTAI